MAVSSGSIRKARKMTARTSFLPLLLFFLLAAGCAKPSGDFLFVSAPEAGAAGGAYEFRLQLDDSIRTYATCLAARLVTSRIPDGKFGLDIRTTSPSGETTIERLMLPLDEQEGARIILGSGSVADFQWDWHPLQAAGPETGTWKVRITPTDPLFAEAIYGIGLSYE